MYWRCRLSKPSLPHLTPQIDLAIWRCEDLRKWAGARRRYRWARVCGAAALQRGVPVGRVADCRHLVLRQEEPRQVVRLLGRHRRLLVPDQPDEIVPSPRGGDRREDDVRVRAAALLALLHAVGAPMALARGLGGVLVEAALCEGRAASAAAPAAPAARARAEPLCCAARLPDAHSRARSSSAHTVLTEQTVQASRLF